MGFFDTVITEHTRCRVIACSPPGRILDADIPLVCVFERYVRVGGSGWRAEKFRELVQCLHNFGWVYINGNAFAEIDFGGEHSRAMGCPPCSLRRTQLDYVMTPEASRTYSTLRES